MRLTGDDLASWRLFGDCGVTILTILMASRHFHEMCGDNSENSEDSDAFTRLAGSNYKGCDATPVIIMRDLYVRDFGIISIIAIITLTLLFAGVIEPQRFRAAGKILHRPKRLKARNSGLSNPSPRVE
jgi:hypothetical protein